MATLRKVDGQDLGMVIITAEFYMEFMPGRCNSDTKAHIAKKTWQSYGPDHAVCHGPLGATVYPTNLAPDRFARSSDIHEPCMGQL